MARHFMAKGTVPKLVKPWITGHYLKRGVSYNGLATWPEYPRKNWLGQSYWLHPQGKNPRTLFTSLTWIQSHLGVEPSGQSGVPEHNRCYKISQGSCTYDPSQSKKNWENEWTNCHCCCFSNAQKHGQGSQTQIALRAKLRHTKEPEGSIMMLAQQWHYFKTAFISHFLQTKPKR